MNKRLKKFITSMKQKGFKFLCGDKDSVIITFVKLFGNDKYVDYVIRVAVDDLTLHNVYAIDSYINTRSIEHIEKTIDESRKESEVK